MAAPKPILFPRGQLPWLEPAVVVGSLVPLVVMVARAVRGTLGANPVAEALNQLGLLALVLLVASLACTPLKTIAGWKWPIRIRKSLGVMAFFYAATHFVTYVAIDQVYDVKAIALDIVKRPFIMVGFAALLILVPLAATSTASMRKRLGAARWTRLHRLAYLAGVLGVTHFVLRVKKDLSEPIVYGAILGALFAVRVGAWARERWAARAAWARDA
jgi:methionine sulfoxide reductase heme-binding subunit